MPLEAYNSSMPLSDFVDARMEQKRAGKSVRTLYCPRCEVSFRKVGSTGKKSCPFCGFRGTKRGD